MPAELLPLSAKQIASIVEAAPVRISIWEGAVRSGKTVASIFGFFAAVATAPKSGLVLITGRTLQTIERNILDPMQDPALFGILSASVAHTRGANTATILGRTVHLIGAADARAEGKLRGLTACLALVDEATLLPEEFWTQLLARLSVPGARLLATTNPGNQNHWLKKKFIDRAGDLDLASWHFILDDNPSLTDEYKTALKAEHTGLWYQRFILGLWVAAAGAIYDMWDPARHVAPAATFPTMTRVLSAGVDYGDTHATRAYLLGIGPDTRPGHEREHRLYVLSEWAPGHATVGEHSTSLRSWLAGQPEAWRNPGWIAVDPAAASFKHQLFHDGMTNVRNAHNSVLPGIRTVAALLATERIVVAEECTALIGEIPGYVWDPKATARGEDAPVKLNDDSCDAFRYAVQTVRMDWRDLIPLAPALPGAPGDDPT